MNKQQATQFRIALTTNLDQVRNNLRLGEGRGTDGKEANFNELYYYMQQLNFSTTDDNMEEAAAIASKLFSNRPVEIQRPPADNGAARKLAALIRDSSTVQHVYPLIGGVDVRLDCDQKKHQHPTIAIGTRDKGGGNRFIATHCTPAWHIANTMTHMAQWAHGLGAMAIGQETFHGQLIPVNGIHYEGFCLNYIGNVKYVLFHCYPMDGSAIKL